MKTIYVLRMCELNAFADESTRHVVQELLAGSSAFTTLEQAQQAAFDDCTETIDFWNRNLEADETGSLVELPGPFDWHHDKAPEASGIGDLWSAEYKKEFEDYEASAADENDEGFGPSGFHFLYRIEAVKLEGFPDQTILDTVYRAGYDPHEGDCPRVDVIRNNDSEFGYPFTVRVHNGHHDFVHGHWTLRQAMAFADEHLNAIPIGPNPRWGQG